MLHKLAIVHTTLLIKYVCISQKDNDFNFKAFISLMIESETKGITSDALQKCIEYVNHPNNKAELILMLQPMLGSEYILESFNKACDYDQKKIDHYLARVTTMAIEEGADLEF